MKLCAILLAIVVALATAESNLRVAFKHGKKEKEGKKNKGKGYYCGETSSNYIRVYNDGCSLNCGTARRYFTTTTTWRSLNDFYTANCDSCVGSCGTAWSYLTSRDYADDYIIGDVGCPTRTCDIYKPVKYVLNV